MVKWMTAQVEYSAILHKIAPLRAMIKDLEESSKEMVVQKEQCEVSIQDLEKKLLAYKDEYAILIRETEGIKTEMERVKAKVTRSTQLLASLNFERQRWEHESEQFVESKRTVIGDVLLSAGFIAYLGFFDQQIRHLLVAEWKDHITNAKLPCKQDLAVVEYLSHPDDRLSWARFGLPDDELCAENAIMLKRFNRFPLVIDPSGQATDFIMNTHAEKGNMTKTSFLDSSFMKALETALRFGSTLLVEDVENIDPVLNSVLNKEVHRNGGRVLIRLGDQEIDFSPAFAIYMTTRDPKARFAPDLCSRVTFVNFTITASGLQSQCLSHVLKSERPDIDKKRSDLLKLQGEFRMTLRNLEKKLLTALAESSGNVLENDALISTLETLKKDSTEVSEKMAQSEQVMEEVSEISSFYSTLSTTCSRLYFVLQSMADINFLYQFSVQYFLDLYKVVLADQAALGGEKDPKLRLEKLSENLFNLLFTSSCQSLMSSDYIAFAVRIVQVRLEDLNSDFDNLELELLLKTGGLAGVPQSSEKAPSGLFTQTQENRLRELTTHKTFKNLFSHVNSNKSAWEKFINTPSHEVGSTGKLPIPDGVWESTGDDMPGKAKHLLRELILLKACRPDRVSVGAKRLVDMVFGKKFLDLPVPNLQQVIVDDTPASTPVLMCAVPGFDPSGQVHDLVDKLNKTCKALALGSPEGYDLAEKAINSGAKEGWWVILKNIHLAPHWIEQMEKKLHRLTPHQNFRLILTMEINPCISTNLIRMSNRLIYEAPAGMKASLKRTLAAMPEERMSKAPAERSKLYLLVAWLHGVILERLRYTPLGWSKKYEFNDSDLRCTMDAIDQWVDAAAQGKSNLSPDKIPWKALRTLLLQVFYGGRIDNEFDVKLLSGFLDQLFTEKAFDSDFALVKEGSEHIPMPEGSKKAQFMEWVDNLPGDDSPVWLGLPATSEVMLREAAGKEMLRHLLTIQSVSYDDGETEGMVGAEKQNEDEGDALPAWMKNLSDVLKTFLKQLPESCPVTSEDASRLGPVQRCLKREAIKVSKLLKQVRSELQECLDISAGTAKPLVAQRDIMRQLNLDIIPTHWRK
jgi:dynein heavy chain 1